MELQRVKEIEDAIARNEMTPQQVFTQMKQLVYREAQCRALCEAKSFQNKIDQLESKLEEIRSIAHNGGLFGFGDQFDALTEIRRLTY